MPLVKISILSQVVNGVVLPFVLIFMLLLVNKKELMGEYVNSRAVQHDRLGNHGHHDRADHGLVLDAASGQLVSSRCGSVEQIPVRALA